MGEEYLLSHCSLVLADIKPSNLFRIAHKSEAYVNELISLWNKKFNKFNLYFKLVGSSSKGCLVFVYREDRLFDFLNDGMTKNFLQSLDYDTCDLNKCLNCVFKKVFCGNFPHEIGCFLGYPLEDVEGFIKNKGKNYLCCGYWKVYQKKKQKQKIFKNYDRTRNFYREKYMEGCDIDKLVI